MGQSRDRIEEREMMGESHFSGSDPLRAAIKANRGPPLITEVVFTPLRWARADDLLM